MACTVSILSTIVTIITQTLRA
ncbi:hypothetical protein HaLaN_33078, partial [Haematococcus lacustris]